MKVQARVPSGSYTHTRRKDKQSHVRPVGQGVKGHGLRLWSTSQVPRR